MQNQLKFLQSFYPYNKTMSSFVIEIALDSYADIFNEYDHSPYKKKDLDPELTNYLNECSEDIPLEYHIILQFNLPKIQANNDKEKGVTDGLKAYYEFTTYNAHNEYKKLLFQSVFNVIIATVLLSFALLIDIIYGNNFILSVFKDGITVGGWVFLWQAITMLAFERKNIKKRYLREKRFRDAFIRFNKIK